MLPSIQRGPRGPGERRDLRVSVLGNDTLGSNLHPGIVEIYKREVAKLPEMLNDPNMRLYASVVE